MLAWCYSVGYGFSFATDLIDAMSMITLKPPSYHEEVFNATCCFASPLSGALRNSRTAHQTSTHAPCIEEQSVLRGVRAEKVPENFG